MRHPPPSRSRLIATLPTWVKWPPSFQVHGPSFTVESYKVALELVVSLRDLNRFLYHPFYGHSTGVETLAPRPHLPQAVERRGRPLTDHGQCPSGKPRTRRDILHEWPLKRWIQSPSKPTFRCIVVGTGANPDRWSLDKSAIRRQYTENLPRFRSLIATNRI